MHKLLFLTLLTTTIQAQWQLQQSHTTASLRGIHSLGNGVAWASGTNGIVLRTTDEGTHWQTCSTPPEAEKLDFRGIQAFDAQTAIIMSSGKGDLSRLYKTTDSCQTWKLVFTNPDQEGFWDAIRFSTDKIASADPCFGQLVGDAVDRHFALFLTLDCGSTWERQIRESPEALSGEALFAASNSSLNVRSSFKRTFVTGGTSGIRELAYWVGVDDTQQADPLKVLPGARPFRFVSRGWTVESIPSQVPTESSGAFSMATKGDPHSTEVIVGGGYKKPDQVGGTSWFQGRYTRWTASITPPHGYRSSVAYSPTQKAWITVGPNGTDLSTDDGRTWHPLRPTTKNADPEEDQHWNALSLPFVVGPKGRIGKLRPDALHH